MLDWGEYGRDEYPGQDNLVHFSNGKPLAKVAASPGSPKEAFERAFYTEQSAFESFLI
jgi:hypothetical protein